MTRKWGIGWLRLVALALGAIWLMGAGGEVGADELRFPGWYSDHMVLQREKPIPVWGWAEAGTAVKVQLGHETQTAKADGNGRWQVTFSPRPVGGPLELSAEAGRKIKVSDVLLGDVWVIGGQSNMQIPVSHGTGAEETIRTSLDNGLRLVHIKENPSYQPVADVAAEWNTATPQTVPKFSCVGYAFARKLREEMRDVPIGLIQVPVGSSVAENWLSREDLQNNPAFSYYVKNVDGAAAKFPELPTMKTKAFDARKYPTLFYNGMIHPLLPCAIRGVIWWQGVANSVPVEKAFEYRKLFPYVIQCWRRYWGGDDLPFIFAEEPTLKWPYHKPGMMVIREAQLMTGLTVPHTAVIVNSDLRNDADPELIHFPQKPPVGQRMALAALAIEYKKPVVYCGPLYDASQTKVQGSKMLIGFTHVGSGLQARQGKLEDFLIAGEDQKFVPAQAEIVGDKVAVWADGVANPKAMRYDWDDWTGATLMNKGGFPASPFRTDDWPIKDQNRSKQADPKKKQG